MWTPVPALRVFCLGGCSARASASTGPRLNGSLAVFLAPPVRTYLKSRFPTGAVYGAAPGPQLRLITCGGTLNPGLGSYLSNVVDTRPGCIS